MTKLKIKLTASLDSDQVTQYLKEKGLNHDITTWSPAEVREFAAWVRFLKK